MYKRLIVWPMRKSQLVVLIILFSIISPLFTLSSQANTTNISIQSGTTQVINLGLVDEGMEIAIDYGVSDNIDAILMQPQQPQPKDPATENMESIMQKPLKAFPDQDHDAHITLRDGYLLDEERELLASKNMLSALSKRGIGGISEPDRIRCFHTWYAAHMVVPNCVGEVVDQLLADVHPKPCSLIQSSEPSLG